MNKSLVFLFAWAILSVKLGFTEWGADAVKSLFCKREFEYGRRIIDESYQIA